jgi:SAM-dependent methyltransferase
LNPFGAAAMADGYASRRPAVHRPILERALGRAVRRALDIGCGSGVSTAALQGLAEQRVGMEPAFAMLQRARTLVPGAEFVHGRAEQLPFRSESTDLMTAAGSLNYVDLDPFFREAARVLTQDGTLLVYDFKTGRSFPNRPDLDDWFATFEARYPWPAGQARPLNPTILRGITTILQVTSSDEFAVELTLSPEFYLNYLMTETNVARAIESGVPPAEIQEWCRQTLAPLWMNRDHPVLFRSYYACMRKLPFTM